MSDVSESSVINMAVCYDFSSKSGILRSQLFFDIKAEAHIKFCANARRRRFFRSLKDDVDFSGHNGQYMPIGLGV